MALLIDGYNLLHVTGIFGEGHDLTALHRSRRALLNFLAVSIDAKERARTTIVFDASSAPPGLPRTLFHHGMTVHFARGYADADAMLEELLEQFEAPRSLLVVSSDHRVQRAARHRGAKSIDSDAWYSELLAARRAAGALPLDVSAKPVGELTPDEVAYWLDKFAEPPTDDAAGQLTGRSADERKSAADLTDPFPPGYADDLLDEFPDASADDPS
jgi:uncharacterized protein